MAVLKPIWTAKPETAKRVRARIEKVLARATALDLRHGDNPASWSLLQHLLPTRANKTRHLAALPYADMPTFMRELRTVDDVAARALEFAILTAARSSEALGARWSEIDLSKRLWTVPESRMKMHVGHAVPLSNAALALLLSLPRDGKYVFANNGRRLGADAMRQALRQLGRADITVHGFRSAFRDWAAEETTHENIVCELALAHAIDSKVEASYRRGALLEKRKLLMFDWADFCAGDAARAADIAA